jgi:SAM-dependent methyltransferase
MHDVDYTKDDYHKTRHAELIDNSELQLAWSECAKEYYFKSLPNGSDVFEFGGALGYNLLALADVNNCHMLELSEIGRANAQKFNIATYANVDEIGGRKFDNILCRHVLEHVDNPLEILQLLKSFLKPNGRMTLVLPVEYSGMKPVTNEIDFHLYSWNPRTILNLVKKSGFTGLTYRFQYFNGRRICLPLRKIAGINVYAKAVNLVGYLTNSKELVIECH